MKVTILGCGSSNGVPHIGSPASNNPKNNRTRASIHIEGEKTSILVDTSPDLRAQALANNITKVDILLYTHTHADHLHGIDDIKAFNYLQQGQIHAYGDAKTMEVITDRFAYCFREPIPEYGWFRPALVAHTIEMLREFRIGEYKITPFTQLHGKVTSVGYRINDFIYSTDVKNFPNESKSILYNADVWIIDCLRREEAPTHSHLKQTLEWIEEYKPKKAYLTHMGTHLDYDILINELPDNVEPCYDGLQFEV